MSKSGLLSRQKAERELWTIKVIAYTEQQTINGILATDAPLIDLAPSATFTDAQKQEDAWGFVYRAETAALARLAADRGTGNEYPC